ncbi:MAG: RimK family protein [Fibrobacteria bacterium]|nr:RimK family protein [Fibrobacteria bacterium]
MRQTIVVVEDLQDWRPYYPSAAVVSAAEYLVGTAGAEAPPHCQVVNLCRGYRYLSTGYYVSLLAEARGHKVFPGIRSVNDLARRSIWGVSVEDLDGRVHKAVDELGVGEARTFSLPFAFGTSPHPALAGVARQLFEMFNCPLLRVKFRRQGSWAIESIQAGSLTGLLPEEEDGFAAALEGFARKVWRSPRSRPRTRCDLAILHNPSEAMPPSNKRALRNFVRVGKSMGIQVDLIERQHLGQIAEWDALLIRETTSVSDHTYLFAKRAESEGLVVMDDPQSILRCTNKIYLADLLRTHKVPGLASIVAGREALRHDPGKLDALGWPVVLKIPDGSFSRGITKVDAPEGIPAALDLHFKQSELVLAQEFMPTEFDWRIGVLGGRPIFACRYFMSKGHWQVVHHKSDGQAVEGRHATVPVMEAPRAVVRLALRAANLIGDGLYGVDIKVGPKGPVVVEVNDNPNLDAGIEDAYLGDDLYRIILQEFLRRLELRHHDFPW